MSSDKKGTREPGHPEPGNYPPPPNPVLRALANILEPLVVHGDLVREKDEQIAELEERRGRSGSRTVSDVVWGFRHYLEQDYARAGDDFLSALRHGQLRVSAGNKITSLVHSADMRLLPRIDDVTLSPEERDIVYSMLTDKFWIYAGRQRRLVGTSIKESFEPLRSEERESFLFWESYLRDHGYRTPRLLQRMPGVILAEHVPAPGADAWLRTVYPSAPESLDAVVDHLIHVSALMSSEGGHIARLKYDLSGKWRDTLIAGGGPLSDALEEVAEAVDALADRSSVAVWADAAALNSLVAEEYSDPSVLLDAYRSDPEEFSRIGFWRLDFESAAYRVLPGHVFRSIRSRSPVVMDNDVERRFRERTYGALSETGLSLDGHDLELEELLVAQRMTLSCPDYILDNGPRSNALTARMLGVRGYEPKGGGSVEHYVRENRRLMESRPDALLERVRSAIRLSA